MVTSEGEGVTLFPRSFVRAPVWPPPLGSRGCRRVLCIPCGRWRLAPCARPRSGEVAWGGRAAGGGASVGAAPPASAARVGRVGRASVRFRSAVVLSTVMTTGRRGACCRARSSAAAIAAWCADCCVWCRGAVSGALPAWVERDGAAPRADSSGVSVPPAPTRCAVSAHPAAGFFASCVPSQRS